MESDGSSNNHNKVDSDDWKTGVFPLSEDNLLTGTLVNVR